MTTGLIFLNLVLLCVHGRLLGKNLGLICWKITRQEVVSKRQNMLFWRECSARLLENYAAGYGLEAARSARLAGM